MLSNIKNNIFFQDWGRNSHYLLTSGLLNRLKAWEGNDGKIYLPKGHCICEYSLKHKIDYDPYSDLHIVIFDGIKDYLEKTYFFEKYSHKNIHIHYVGKFDFFWNDIPNSNLLYNQDLNEFIKNLEEVKKKFPITYSQHSRRFFITFSNLQKNYKNFFKFHFSRETLIYFGNIKPKNSYVSNLIKKYKIDKLKIEYLLINDNSFHLLKKLKIFVELIFQIKDFNKKVSDYYYLIEFITIFFRLIISNQIKNNNKSFIYDGCFLNNNFFNIYNSYGGNQHNYIDLGSKVGFDSIYPRVDDIVKYRSKYHFVSLDEELLNYDKFILEEYFIQKIINFNKSLVI